MITQVSYFSLSGKIYDILVRTSDVWQAETNANVFIQLHGDLRDSRELELTNSNYSNPFERDQTDMFVMTVINVGNVINVTVRHDNTGRGPGWILDGVIIKDTVEKESWKCEHFGWLTTEFSISKSSTCKKGNDSYFLHKRKNCRAQT